MKEITENQIDKLLKDVASIKSALAENKPVLKQLLLPIHFRIISLIGGLAIIGLSILYYYLLEKYGSYYDIPGSLRTMSLLLVITAYILVVVLKRFLWVKSIKKMDSDYTFGKIIKQIYSYQLFHVWIPIQLIMAFFIGYAIYFDYERYIVSVAGIGIGIIYNSIGGITKIWQYLATGYWLIVTGMLPFILPGAPALLLLALSMGVALILFFLISGRSLEIEEEE